MSTPEDSMYTDSQSSHALHNKNCYLFLQNVIISSDNLILSPEGKEIVDQIALIKGAGFNPLSRYADLYKRLFDHFDENINAIYSANQGAISENNNDVYRDNSVAISQLDDFVFSLYANDNYILEETFSSVEDIALGKRPSSPGLEGAMTERVRDRGATVNLESTSPAYEGSNIGRFSAMMAKKYMPGHGTSLSTKRAYEWNKDGPITEYRFGTQGQRHNGEARVSPLFEKFLKVQARKQAQERQQQAKERILRGEQPADFVDDSITHIYFNNLGRDRTDAEGLKERALTLELEALEKHHSNVAVITLPADKGLMSSHDYEKIKPEDNLTKEAIKNEFLQIARKDGKPLNKVKDFHISLKIRQKIFCNVWGEYSPATEDAILNHLINNSFKALGYEEKTILSPAERQAVYFHFIKYELTNHIVNALKPKSINFTCKDAIDRGGVSSAHYNLMKSFEPGSPVPMRREEFERALHAAPVMVKGRGMNHHINLIWNAVDAYVNQNYLELQKDPDKAWLIEWRDFNCPHERIDALLKQRIIECKKDLRAAEVNMDSNDPNLIKPKEILQKGLAILENIEQLRMNDVSGKRLLLEAAVRTGSMALHPERQKEQHFESYEKNNKDLCIKYPQLYIAGGLMKAFAGVILYALSLGIVKKVASEGWSTFKAGNEAAPRASLQANMKNMKTTLSDFQSHKLSKDDSRLGSTTDPEKAITPKP